MYEVARSCRVCHSLWLSRFSVADELRCSWADLGFRACPWRGLDSCPESVPARLAAAWVLIVCGTCRLAHRWPRRFGDSGIRPAGRFPPGVDPGGAGTPRRFPGRGALSRSISFGELTAAPYNDSILLRTRLKVRQPDRLLAVTSDRDQQALSDQLDRTVVPDLKGIDGVGQVTVDGVRDLQVTVTPDDTKTAKAGLTSAAIGQALQAGGVTVPAGSFDEDGSNRTVQVGGGFTSLKQIQDLMVTGAPGKKPVRLADVATVKEEQATADSITRTDGEPSLAVNVTMDHDGSAVAISDVVQDRLADMRGDLGAGATITVVSDQGPAVKKSIDGLTTEGALASVRLPPVNKNVE